MATFSVLALIILLNALIYGWGWLMKIIWTDKDYAEIEKIFISAVLAVFYLSIFSAIILHIIKWGAVLIKIT